MGLLSSTSFESCQREAGEKIKFTYEVNPGEVWEENEFWVELSGRMDPDGSLEFVSTLKVWKGLVSS